MKKILLIFIMMTTAVFADSQNFLVENTEMVDVYFNIFNAISALFQNGSYLDLLKLAFLLGGFFVFAGGILKAWESNTNQKIISPYFVYSAVVVALLTVSLSSHKTTMVITTNNLPSYCSTTSSNTVGTMVELPAVIGYSFATMNLIGREMTRMAEMAFTKPSSSGTTSMTDSGGYLGTLKHTLKLMSYDPNKITLKNNMSGTGESTDLISLWQKHFNKCVYEVANNKGAEGRKKIGELKASKDIYKWTKDFLDYKFQGSTKATGEALMTMNGVSLSCRNNFVFLEESINILKQENECFFSEMNGGVLQLITGQTGMTGSNFDEISIQSGLITALESSANMGSIGVSSGTTYATGKTKAEFIQGSMASGMYMAEMLPYLQMTTRAVLYGFFPFVFVIFILPGGLKVIAQYGQTLLWIELWGPTAAVVNMLVNIKAENNLSEYYSEEGLTLMSSADMLSDASTIAGIGGMLYMSVPALTWLILKGSGHMLGNMTGAVTAGLTANLKSQSVAKDMSMNRASKMSGNSITETINNIEASNMTNKVSDGNAFKSVGMNQTLDTKTTTNKAQRLAEVEKVASQGGKQQFIDTQVKKSGYDAVSEKADVDAKTEAGGKQVVSDNAYVKTSTELETSKKEIKSAGSKEKVVDTKSDMSNKNFNKDLEVNKSTTTSDFGNLGKKEGAEISGTSKVVSKKGAKSFEDAKVQEVAKVVETASKKKALAGGNDAVVKTESDMEAKEFAKKDVVNEGTSTKDYKNLGKQEVAETKSTSANVDKHGQAKIQSNLTNKKNEETIKDSTRYSEIGGNKDKFFEQQSKNDFRTKEKVDFLKGDSNGDGKLSDNEINKLASINNVSAKSQVLAEDVKQQALVQEGKKLNSSDSQEAKEAKAKGQSQGGLNKDLATAVAFNSGAGVKVDTFNKRKDNKSVENFEDSNVQAENIADQESSSKMLDVSKAQNEANSLAKDITSYDDEAKKQIEKLVSNGTNRTKAEKAVLGSLAKEGYASDKLTAKTLGNEIGEIKKAKEKDLAKTGVSAESIEKQKEAIAKLDEFSKNENFTEDQKKGFKASADNMRKSISKYNNLNKEYDKKMADKVAEYENAGLVRVDRKTGDIKFLDTKKQLDSASDSQKMMILKKIQGASQGRTTEMNDLDGMESKKVKSLMGSNTTDIKKAVNEWSKTGNYNYDLGYRAVDAGMVDRETFANMNTAVNAVKNSIGVVGAGKFLAGK
ncbi:hypothetical protein ALC152_05070 [Arcobacter sp. 15-2]|uniref:conjugal transfer protein TraG N-terminal domain-containing protein n=1 Tax=Arcobacter sp. 15-2 TaxID=3374109 RepID=UPI00399CDB75